MKDIEIVQVNIFGDDKPGLTTSFTEILARYDAFILDIGQANIHQSLTLGILFRTTKDKSGFIMKDLLFKASELGVQIGFKAIGLDTHKSRPVIIELDIEVQVERRRERVGKALVFGIGQDIGFNIGRTGNLERRAFFFGSEGRDSGSDGLRFGNRSNHGLGFGALSGCGINSGSSGSVSSSGSRCGGFLGRGSFSSRGCGRLSFCGGRLSSGRIGRCGRCGGFLGRSSFSSSGGCGLFCSRLGFSSSCGSVSGRRGSFLGKNASDSQPKHDCRYLHGLHSISFSCDLYQQSSLFFHYIANRI